MLELKLTGPLCPPAAGGEPQSIVVLLHGYGSDGNDLIALAPLWAEALPQTLFIAPHAPFPCEMGPFGRQWFSLASFDSAHVIAGLREVAPLLDSFLDQQLAAHRLAADRLALVGFSQGTMLALYTGLRRRQAVGGIVGFSGALYGGTTGTDAITSRPPVLLVHGEDDGVVPFESMAAAETRLRAAGVTVTACARPQLGHGIDEVGIRRARDFLGHILS